MFRLKETLSTMNQAHEAQSAIPPTLQTPLTPTARTMQSPGKSLILFTTTYSVLFTYVDNVDKCILINTGC